MFIAMAAPLAAPGLIFAAAIAIGITSITSIRHVVVQFRALKELKNKTALLKELFRWGTEHRIQVCCMMGFIAGIIVVATLLLSGGGVAPAIIAAISAPFAAAAASAGIQLGLGALAAFTLILASLSISHNLKRFAAWLDSFRYDAAAAKEIKPLIKLNSDPWKKSRKNETLSYVNQKGYFTAIFKGVKSTVSNNFSSPDEELLLKCKSPSNHAHRD